MLAIVGGKGGCGKTTTALGLASAFAHAGERALVVDADLAMPNLHARADTDLVPGLGAVADGEPPREVARHSDRFPGVDVVPAGRATGPAPPEALGRVRQIEGRVVVDCPAGATEAVAHPVRAADAALVVATPDRPSRVDAAKTARMVETLDTRLAGAVLTRASHGPASCPARGPLRRECPVVATVPELDDSAGCVLDDPAARSSYDRLAERLSERNV